MLPQTIEYGLRAMAHLAGRRGEGVKAADIAQAAGIPRHYVAKLLRRLVVAGLLESQRGKGGGFVLSAAPAQIRFIDIMRALDFDVVGDHCVFGYDACDEVCPCALHEPWERLKRAVIAWGEQTSLADLGPGHPRLPRGSGGKSGA